jgi:hypothetical protein
MVSIVTTARAVARHERKRRMRPHSASADAARRRRTLDLRADTMREAFAQATKNPPLGGFLVCLAAPEGFEPPNV